jgi:hypothetical protein
MQGLGKVRRVRDQAQSDDIGKEEESKSKIRSPCDTKVPSQLIRVRVQESLKQNRIFSDVNLERVGSPPSGGLDDGRGGTCAG